MIIGVLLFGWNKAAGWLRRNPMENPGFLARRHYTCYSFCAGGVSLEHVSIPPKTTTGSTLKTLWSLKKKNIYLDYKIYALRKWGYYIWFRTIISEVWSNFGCVTKDRHRSVLVGWQDDNGWVGHCMSSKAQRGLKLWFTQPTLSWELHDLENLAPVFNIDDRKTFWFWDWLPILSIQARRSSERMEGFFHVSWFIIYHSVRLWRPKWIS